MQVFFTTQIEDNTAVLSGDEAHHCLHVLRKKVGDSIDLTDGKGQFYKGVIEQTKRSFCTVKLVEIIKDEIHRTYKIHLAISPPKNPKRFEWLIEKIVELGVDRITPIICRRSEKRNWNAGRLEKRIISAMKQSMSSRLPVLDEAVLFDKWISSVEAPQKFIAWVSKAHKHNLSDQCLPAKDTCILIGPEGDFTSEEIDKALEMQFKPTALGKSRLRTETAGLASIITVHVINNTL